MVKRITFFLFFFACFSAVYAQEETEKPDSVIMLKEVVVSAPKHIYRIDRQIILPTKEQINSSMSGYSLLNKIALPKIKVDETLNSISGIGINGDVQIRINNILASQEDIISLNVKDLVRIEYIEKPNVPYGENVGAVINFIVRRRDSGVQIGTNLVNAFTTGYGSDNIFLKLNKGRSELGLNYSFGYNIFDGIIKEEQVKYKISNDSVHYIDKQGYKSDYENYKHTIQLNYNYVNPMKNVLNVTFRGIFNDNPRNMNFQHAKETNRANYDLKNIRKDNYYSPSIDVYCLHYLDSTQTLTANAVGAYINSDYYYSLIETDANLSVDAANYTYRTKGIKYSLMSELLYEKTFKSNVLSAGLQFSGNNLENKYIFDRQESTKMANTNLYVYSQIRGKIEKLNYVLGLGVSNQHNRQNSTGYTYWTVRPALTVAYPVFGGANISYQFNVRSNLPKPDNLTNMKLQLNEHEYFIGNPELKPFRNYINTMTFDRQTSKLYVQLSSTFMMSPNAVMPTLERKITDNRNIVFEFSGKNQKSVNQFNSQVYLQYEILPQKLVVSGYGGINRFWNSGDSYTHTYTGYFGGIQAEIYVGKWNVSGNIDSRYNTLFGETIWYNEPSSSLNVAYTCKNTQLGLGYHYPFRKNGLDNGEKLSDKYIEKRTWTYNKNYANMLSFKFVWNLNLGKTKQATKQKITNSDMDSGIIKR